MFRLMFTIITVVYLPLNYYVGLRLWQGLILYFPTIKKVVYWLSFWLLSSSFIVSRWAGGLLPEVINKAAVIMGYYWVVGIFYLLVIITFLDIVRFAAKYFTFLSGYRGSSSHVGVVAALLVVMLLSYGTWNAQNPQVVKYNITIPKEANNLNELHVVMVSDIHLGREINNKRLQDMVKMINDRNPDLVLIPGDIIQEADYFIQQNMMDTLAGIKSKHGTFASLGNHEYYGGMTEELVNYLEQGGIKVLRDSYVEIEDSIYIVGREDAAAERGRQSKRKDWGEVLSGIDKSQPIILMNHQPIELEEAQMQGIDLQVSGHTHRGQIFPANLITSRLFEQDWGYLKKGTLNLIVSCGYGTWGPPFRLGNTPEVVEILVSFQ